MLNEEKELSVSVYWRSGAYINTHDSEFDVGYAELRAQFGDPYYARVLDEDDFTTYTINP